MVYRGAYAMKKITAPARPRLLFAKTPPGKAAQAAMASGYRMPSLMAEKTPGNAVDAAVLVLLSPPAEAKTRQNLLEWNVLLIRRNEYPGVHSGQISFPGGKREKADAGLWETACREAFEEIGVNPAQLEKAGPLTSLYVPPSNFLIHPFVAAAHLDAIRPDPREVVDYKEIAIKAFDPVKAVCMDFADASGALKAAPAWLHEEYVIWGATAMILAELYRCVADGALVIT